MSADCASSLPLWQIIVGGIASGFAVLLLVAALAWLVTR